MFRQGENNKVPPLVRVGGKFNTVTTLWVMLSCLVEDPRNESGGILGIFDGLGHFLKNDS